MPEGIEPNGTPAASDTAGQQPTTTAHSTQTVNDSASLAQGQPAASQSEPGASADVANPAAQRMAQEAAAYRTKLRDAEKIIAEYQAKEKAAEDAKLSEMERLQKQLAEEQAARARVETEAQERIIRSEVRTEAARLGINPQLAARIIDYAAIEYENGDPTNIATLLQTAAQEYDIAPAAQVTTTSTPAAAPRPSAGAPASPARSATSTGGALTRDYIERMPVREYQLRRDEVQEWIRTHPNG